MSGLEVRPLLLTCAPGLMTPPTSGRCNLSPLAYCVVPQSTGVKTVQAPSSEEEYRNSLASPFYLLHPSFSPTGHRLHEQWELLCPADALPPSFTLLETLYIRIKYVPNLRRIFCFPWFLKEQIAIIRLNSFLR